MLTRKQYELLIFIDKRLMEDGVPPSFDEMKDALGLRSKSGIHRLITGLEERGFIRRLPYRARALEVLKLPDNYIAPKPLRIEGEPTPISPNYGFSPNVIEADFNKKPEIVSAPADSMQLPFLGKVAAGTPIEALSDHSNLIDVPSSFIGAGEHYALEIDGESMIDAGIQDGDTVIIRRCDSADNGTIVVALVDDTEVTLKRIRRKGNSIALEPANTAYETRICGPDQVKVQGRLVGLMRHY
jgi:repressor LexA